MYKRDDPGGTFYGYTCVQKLQCNELSRGHPIFFCQLKDKFRATKLKFVHFEPITNERTYCEKALKIFKSTKADQIQNIYTMKVKKIKGVSF